MGVRAVIAAPLIRSARTVIPTRDVIPASRLNPAQAGIQYADHRGSDAELVFRVAPTPGVRRHDELAAALRSR